MPFGPCLADWYEAASASAFRQMYVVIVPVMPDTKKVPSPCSLLDWAHRLPRLARHFKGLARSVCCTVDPLCAPEQARAKKAEERRAKKEAEAAAKAKAKASAKSGADDGAKGADADVAAEDTPKGEGAPATDEAKGADAMETDAAPAAAAASEALKLLLSGRKETRS